MCTKDPEKGTFKITVRPPNQGNHGVANPESQFTGKHSEQRAKPVSVLSHCGGRSACKEVYVSACPFPTSPIVKSPELNFDVSSTKGCSCVISQPVFFRSESCSALNRSLPQGLSCQMTACDTTVWGSGPKRQEHRRGVCYRHTVPCSELH